MIYPWHQTVWEQLNAARAAEHLPHALLFSGYQGCGNEAFAQQVIQSLLCLSPVSETRLACGTCRSCQVFIGNAHPDLMQVNVPDDKQIISVDQVRALTRFLELSCSYSPVRVALIVQAERMNLNAANSLLKSLEEPSEHTHIILLSNQPQDLLPTIRSRCQQIRLPLPARKQASDWLQQQNPEQAIEALLTIAGGRPLLAKELDNGELIAAQSQWLQQLLRVLNQTASVTEVGAEWAKQDKNALLDWQLAIVHQLLKQGADAQSSVDEKLKESCKSKDLWQLYDKLLEMKALSAHPLNAALFAENMLALWLVNNNK